MFNENNSAAWDLPACDGPRTSYVIASIQHARGIEPLHLTYEELDSDYGASVARVLDFLGEPVRAEDVAPPTLARQANAESEAWVDRFRSDLRRHEDSELAA